MNSGLLTDRLIFDEIMLDYQRRDSNKFIYWFGAHQCVTFCLPEHAQTISSDGHRFEQTPLFLPNFDLISLSSVTILIGTTWKHDARIMLSVFK